MDVDSQTITAFLVGLAAGLAVLALLVPFLRKRFRSVYRTQIEDYEQTIVDLRQERADDRETNRRLRRELAVSTPEHLTETREELRQANQQLDLLGDEIARAKHDLAERDRSLREARLAIQEIRIQLEEERFDGRQDGRHLSVDEALADQDRQVIAGSPGMPPATDRRDTGSDYEGGGAPHDADGTDQGPASDDPADLDRPGGDWPAERAASEPIEGELAFGAGADDLGELPMEEDGDARQDGATGQTGRSDGPPSPGGDTAHADDGSGSPDFLVRDATAGETSSA